MTNMVQTSADEKTYCVVANIVLHILSLFNHLLFFCKTWYQAQRKISRHCTHIFSLNISTEKCIIGNYQSYYQTYQTFICLFYCCVMMETKDMQLQGKAHINFFVAAPVAQDQHSYSICELSHEHVAHLSSDIYCSVA